MENLRIKWKSVHMKRRNILRVLLACVAMIASSVMPVNAASTQNEYICLEDMACELVEPSDLGCWKTSIIPQSQGQIDENFPAHSLCPMDSSISLAVNDIITFNCSYSPSSASMDFGVISSSGRFYHINVKGAVSIKQSESAKAEAIGWRSGTILHKLCVWLGS